VNAVWLDLATEAARRLRAAGAAVLRRDHGYPELLLAPGAPLPVEAERLRRLLEPAVERGAVVRRTDVYAAEPPQQPTVAVLSLLAVPVAQTLGVEGALAVYDTEPRTWTTSEQRALQSLARRLAQLALRERLEQLTRRADALEESPHPIVVCAADGSALDMNAAARELLARTGAPLHPGLLPANHYHLVHACLEGRQHFRNVEAAAGDRLLCWDYLPHPERALVYLFGLDVTEHRLVEEQLRHDALHDALTGLPNRFLFMERLAHTIVRAKRKEGPQFAVLFLDLDRFKVINDSLGHHVGDQLLVTVARRLQACVRPADTVARLGGDEFAILLEEIHDPADATRVADRILHALGEPIDLGGYETFTSGSIGIALSSFAYDRPELLLRNADMAMYRAKAAGRNRFEVFDRAMHAEALQRLQTETDLRRAVERGEFVLLYQPIVALATGKIRGFEALLRWANPERGLLRPQAFLAVAEETGLIVPIGQWVVRQACHQAQVWNARYLGREALQVGINLSVREFLQPDLVGRLEQVLGETGLDPKLLHLEITESLVIDNADAANAVLQRLGALGVRLYMDDFGTGYSSLSYLHVLPVEAIKIDRSFVQRLDADERAAHLVRSILTLAEGLGIPTVAEGVETPQQLAQLRAWGCTFAQGHLFSPPLDAAEFEALLAGDPSW